jgi:hypothetical protein
MIANPILPGFNPDPSIVRVGDDYYIATSTFEWFPGVQIHHSRDLVHWRLLARPLNRATQLNMLGDPDSCGVWAPCLSYADGLFWLIYTDVKRFGRTSVAGSSGASMRDFHNYLVTSLRIDGEWSDPVYLNGSGFDPSLFHDDDGRKYLLNMLWDHRPGHNRFAGIVLQEYSVKERKLTGDRINIFQGTLLGLTEGPHLYKRNGWYYLLTAEGGTNWNHAVTMARSRNLTGPYELHPDTYIVSARHRPDAELQRAGHASLVETQNGETYMAYLCGRPLRNRGRCTLGRETAIQKMVWSEDGWLRTLANDPDQSFLTEAEVPTVVGPIKAAVPKPRPKAYIKSIKFSDDTELHLARHEILVFVGPNNAGKSAALREIFSNIQTPNVRHVVIKSVIFGTEGSETDAVAWADSLPRRPQIDPNTLELPSGSLRRSDFQGHWSNGARGGGFQSLASLVAVLVSADGRIQFSNHVQAINLYSETPAAPCSTARSQLDRFAWRTEPSSRTYPTPTAGQPVTFNASATGGYPPYGYSRSGISGLTGSQSAQFTPTSAGTYTASIQVTDSHSISASNTCPYKRSV